MLLVDDAEAEAGELDRRLDQRVGADDQAQLAAGEPVQGLPAASRPGVAPVSSANGVASAASSLPRVDRVLLGQGLGRRHQHRLVAGFERPQHRVERDHGLARADLPHQQPLHRLAGVEVGVDLVEGRAAGRRSARTAASRASAPTSSPGLPSRGAGRAVRCVRLRRREERLVEEELFEGEPLPRLLDVLVALREVDRPDRVADPGQPAAAPAAPPAAPRARSAPSAHRLLHPLAGSAAALQLLGRRVDRDQLRACGPTGSPRPRSPASSSYSETRKPRLSR